jgi:hypothetical protein
LIAEIELADQVGLDAFSASFRPPAPVPVSLRHVLPLLASAEPNIRCPPRSASSPKLLQTPDENFTDPDSRIRKT